MPPRRYGWDDAGRLFWRLLFLGIIAGVLFVGSGVLLKPAFPLGLPNGYQGETLFLLMGAASLGLAHVAAAFMEKASDWYTLGFSPAAWQPRALGLSFIGGATLVALSVGILLAVGMARVQPSEPGSLGPHVIQTLLLAAGWTLVDALLLRGYVFGSINKRWGGWMAVGVTTLLGILATLAAGRLAAAPIVSAVALGLFLGALRVRTEGLAAPWLAHFAFVWVQCGVLHTQLAPLGLEAPPNYIIAFGPPELLSGAGYGVDGGLVCAALLIAAAWWLMREEPREIAPTRV